MCHFTQHSNQILYFNYFQKPDSTHLSYLFYWEQPFDFQLRAKSFHIEWSAEIKLIIRSINPGTYTLTQRNTSISAVRLEYEFDV